MRTPLSGGLAAASLGLLVAGLALRSWQLVLLALPPVIVLALGSLFPPARPRLTAVRTLSRDRAEAGRDVDVHLVVQNTGPALDLVAATRAHSQVDVGASPRGSLALLKVSRARAAIAGRDFVTPDDVKAVAMPALAHRIILKPDPWIRGVRTASILADVLGQVPVPKVP